MNIDFVSNSSLRNLVFVGDTLEFSKSLSSSREPVTLESSPEGAAAVEGRSYDFATPGEYVFTLGEVGFPGWKRAHILVLPTEIASAPMFEDTRLLRNLTRQILGSLWSELGTSANWSGLTLEQPFPMLANGECPNLRNYGAP